MTQTSRTSDERILEMTYAGGMVKHLGLQMYSGLVGAVAELIANAWDADAPRVDVTVPFDANWQSSSTVFKVRDYGFGMSFEECDKAFLTVGRDRRKIVGSDRTASGRRVMGRKGIGKLACFGVAKRMEVRTVKNGWLTHFSMNYDAIVNEQAEEFVSSYRPDILADHETNEKDGTTILLKQIQVNRRQTEEQFRLSMARRFSVLSDDFVININGRSLQRGEATFQFRYPPDPDGWNEEDVGGVGAIRWWAGFTAETIKDDEARGFVVLVRGKMAQAPFFFDLSGGTFGQHGMQYLTGEVETDGLDVERDVIATDRASVRWDDPIAAPLHEWGQSKIKELLAEWARNRTEEKIDNLRTKLGENKWQRLNNFASSERKEIMRAIRTFANIPTMDDERFVEIVDLLLRAYEDQNFMNMIRALNALDMTDQDRFLEFMVEVNILEAVKTASIIRARIEVVRQLKKLIEEKAPEKKAGAPMDMHRLLRDNPWLIDPAWRTLAHERSLDTLLGDHFNIEPILEEETGGRRFDFFCLRDSQHCVVVEVKRPGDLCGRDEIRQIQDYIFYIRHQVEQGTLTKGMMVTGYLIIGRLRDSDRQHRESAKTDLIDVVTWTEVWNRSEQLYGEFLELVKSNAPAEDPRIQALDELDQVSG